MFVPGIVNVACPNAAHEICPKYIHFCFRFFFCFDLFCFVSVCVLRKIRNSVIEKRGFCSPVSSVLKNDSGIWFDRRSENCDMCSRL